MLAVPAKKEKTTTLIVQAVNQLLWPAVCINCSQRICETDNNLCSDCWAQLLACTSADYCRRCGREAGRYAQLEGTCPDCQSKEIHFDQIARSGIYTDALKKMILSFKKSKTELDRTLAFLANSALQGSGFFDQIDLFVPVPLHFTRRLSRGYNQSHLIAKKLHHPKALVNTDLVRIKKTKFQYSLTSKLKRQKNVAGAFAVRKGHQLADKNICLIDDIKTSGATLNECARVLKQAKASKVFALTMSVAGQ